MTAVDTTKNNLLELTDEFAPGESNFIKVDDFRFYYGEKRALHGITLEIHLVR